MLYVIYWFYINWYFYKQVYKEKFNILERAGAYPLTAYSMIKHVNRQIAFVGFDGGASVAKCWGLIAIGIATLIFPFPIVLLYFVLTFIAILEIQKYMVILNKLNGYPNYTNCKLTSIDWIVIISFSPISLMYIIGFCLGIK